MKMRSIFNIGEIGRFTRLAVFSLVLASISFVSGQVNSGRISGTVTDSNFSAEYGRNSGAQINIVTKRGTNGYHARRSSF